MPAIAALTLNDGTEPTPVAQTFGILSRGPVVSWENRASSYPVEWPKISNSHTKTKNGLTRIRYKFEMPVTEVLSSGANPVKVGTIMADVSIIIPERSTVTQRKHFLAYLRGAVGQTGFGDVVRNAEPYY